MVLLNKINLFLEMNGYGFFIWSSYIVWFILLLLLTVKVILRKKSIEKKVKYINAKQR
ncbi:MAG: heme exporter protein CcmD [Rickettsiales bacterium]|nr:heme exporter protein CcmD [Rickettsiales bacterium]OUV81300.1 MAG: heme exporter protein CcmD [Rickettsiales bacterium TMED131]